MVDDGISAIIARSPQQVGQRVLILGTMALRASLEATDSSRCEEQCRWLLPWLSEVGCDLELTPVEKTILGSPWRQVSDSERVDLNWASESAWFLAATLGWNPLPSWLERVTPFNAYTHFHLLKETAIERAASARFVDARNSARVARVTLSIRSFLQQERVSETLRTQLAEINRQLLEKSGIEVSSDEDQEARTIVRSMTSQQLATCAGVYFCRYAASLWLLQKQKRWLEQ
jgi:hypothetical protein